MTEWHSCVAPGVAPDTSEASSVAIASRLRPGQGRCREKREIEAIPENKACLVSKVTKVLLGQ